MTTSLRSVVTVVVVGVAAAFAPHTSRVHRVSRGAPRAALALPTLPTLPIPRALNPFDWSVDRPATRFRVEGQELFRQIGVAPDADFDEIKAVVAGLKEKYKKEPKKAIKAEVAMDKIMELRLRQASRGQLAKSGESSYADSVSSLRDASQLKKGYKAPKWTNGLVKVTTKAKAAQSAKWLFGAAFVGSAVLPAYNGAFTALIVVTGANTLYKNGRPKQAQMEDMPRTTDFPSYGEFGKIVCITAAAVALANILNLGVARPLIIPKLLAGQFAAEQVAIWCYAITSMVSLSFFHIYPKGVKAKPKKS